MPGGLPFFEPISCAIVIALFASILVPLVSTFVVSAVCRFTTAVGGVVVVRALVIARLGMSSRAGTRAAPVGTGAVAESVFEIILEF